MPLIDSKGMSVGSTNRLDGSDDPCETERRIIFTGIRVVEAIDWLITATAQMHGEAKAKDDVAAALNAFVDARIKAALKPKRMERPPLDIEEEASAQ